MTINLTEPIFTNEDAAREHLETIRWPNGPFCPHCGNAEPSRITKLEGKSHRKGLYQCNECDGHFSVTVGSVMERSHIPLTKWVLGYHLMAASKKGMSAHQLHRMLGISYKSAWFLAMRIRESMAAPLPKGGLGGTNKVVESDETLVGGKAKNRAYAKEPPKKATVLSLIERDGSARSYHVPNVTAKTLRPIIVQTASRKSWLMTDELATYASIGKEFSGHGTVNHSADEYVKLGGFIHTNTAENFFSILKRGIYGVYHHVSEAHLHRYLVGFDFRYSHRAKLGYSDTDRAVIAIKGAAGKRLFYRQPYKPEHEEPPIPF